MKPDPARPEESAGVRFPPPLLFVTALAAGGLLDRAAPLAGGYSNARPIGIALVAAGLALDAWSLATLRRARTTILPWGRADALVTSGPFRFTRNPIYLGYALETAGLALAMGSWWTWIFLAAGIHAATTLVIAREERHLRARFGEAYDVYRRRTRRWIGTQAPRAKK